MIDDRLTDKQKRILADNSGLIEDMRRKVEAEAVRHGAREWEAKEVSAQTCVCPFDHAPEQSCEDAMWQHKDDRQSAPVRVICPTCGENIGLTEPDELILPIVSGNMLGMFVCHVCQSGWRISVEFKSFKTDD